jgi:hypothetical protein
MAIRAASFKVRAIVFMRQVALSRPPFLAIVLNPQGKNPDPNDKETPQ